MRKIRNEELDRLTVEEYKKSEKNKITIVLDNVRSLQNVGSAFRTADAFRIEQILLCGITGQPPHRDITRSALGATESVNWSYQHDCLTAVQALQQSGWKVFAIEQVQAATLLQNFNHNQEERVAFVFGHEVKGVAQHVVDACDGSIEIPQFGSKHSLNISVSVGIVLWHTLAQTL